MYFIFPPHVYMTALWKQYLFISTDYLPLLVESVHDTDKVSRTIDESLSLNLVPTVECPMIFLGY